MRGGEQGNLIARAGLKPVAQFLCLACALVRIGSGFLGIWAKVIKRVGQTSRRDLCLEPRQDQRGDLFSGLFMDQMTTRGDLGILSARHLSCRLA